MKTYKIPRITSLLLLLLITTIAISCTRDDDDPEIVEVRVNGNLVFEDGGDFNGDVDGDFIGNGGSGSSTFFWTNSLNTADYNADITSSSSGVFEMEVRDAKGDLVLDRSLQGGSEPDSFSGVTSAGAPGVWSVTIRLSSFNGDGSFSLSEGD